MVKPNSPITHSELLQQQTKLKQQVEQILALAKRKGATAAEVDIGTNQGFTVTVRMGEIETLEHHRDKAVGITVYFDQRKGSASTNDLTEQSIEKTVEAACSIAKYTESDPYQGLADKALLAFNYQTPELYFPWSITPEQAIELATQCETFGRNIDKRINNSEGASVSTHESLFAYGNSHGFIGSFPTSRHELSCVLVAKDGDSMQRDYDYTVARDPQDLLSAEQVAKQAAQNTVARLNPKRLKTGNYPVLYSAELARGFWGTLIAAISGGNLYRKASFLCEHLNHAIFPNFINIEENPYLPRGLATTPFDDEGVATKKHHIVEQGILKSYVLSSYSARKLNMQTTGNAGGVHNLLIQPNSGDLNDLLKRMNTGLYITEMMGNSVNLVTGDYSRGAFGYWVENGKIQYPVEEITVAGNLRQMFQQIVAVGNNVDKRGSIQSGSVLVAEMMVAGD